MEKFENLFEISHSRLNFVQRPFSSDGL
jgi:hypothetical protein